MKFGNIPLTEAVGAILAHSHHLSDRVLKKGRVLSDTDVADLQRVGYGSIVGAIVEPEDVPEDEAASRLAFAIRGDGLYTTAPFTGRCNLIADGDGLLLIDEARLERLNLVDESMTVATLPAFTRIGERRMVATIKIIPFAVGHSDLNRCLEITSESTPIIRRASFRSRSVGLIQTTLPGTRDAVLDKTASILSARLGNLHASLGREIRCAHDEAAIAPAISDLLGSSHDLILISGASAIVDRRDMVPAAIVRAGGTIDHFGMPVDPGNLLLLAHHGDVPVLGLPGCARSPKFNGLDLVLERLAADMQIARTDIMRMGAGGLLKEFVDRPQPRDDRPRPVKAELPSVTAVVMAAGQSRRMGSLNKLLADIDGVPMVARVVDAALASQAARVFVVVGHESDRVRRALEGRSVDFVVNPDYADGLSTSLRAGLAALDEKSQAALICLGDMPRLTAEQLDRLIAAYDPIEGRAICVPTYRGKRGNPVLWDRRFFEEMSDLSGDVGARHLIGANAEVVVEVEMDDDAVLIDIDSPSALTALDNGTAG